MAKATETFKTTNAEQQKRIMSEQRRADEQKLSAAPEALPNALHLHHPAGHHQQVLPMQSHAAPGALLYPTTMTGGTPSQTWMPAPYSYPQRGSSALDAAAQQRMSVTTPMTIDGSAHNVTSERVMSSTVISEHHVNPVPEDSVQYVEVPVIEEVIRHVPKKEIVEIEKRVPRYEYNWVERIVEVPQVQVVDKHVEVPRIQEIIKHVPVKQIVDVPREVVRYVPKIETKIVEQEVEVVGETIEVPKPYLVENRVVVPRYFDQEVPTVVCQRLQPVITESETDFIDCELKEYCPQLIPVDVYIPRPISRNLIAANKYEQHQVVDVPPAQYNSLVKSLNGHIVEKEYQSMYVRMADGSIPMLHGLGSSIVPPLSQDWNHHHDKGKFHVAPTHGALLPGQFDSDTLFAQHGTNFGKTNSVSTPGMPPSRMTASANQVAAPKQLIAAV